MTTHTDNTVTHRPGPIADRNREFKTDEGAA